MEGTPRGSVDDRQGGRAAGDSRGVGVQGPRAAYRNIRRRVPQIMDSSDTPDTPSLSAGRGRLTCERQDEWSLDVSYYEERLDEVRPRLRAPIGQIVLMDIEEHEAEQIRARVPCLFLLHDGDRQLRCTLKRIRWSDGHPYRVDLDVLSRHARVPRSGGTLASS